MLVLVGSGEYLAPMEPVDRLLLDSLSGPAQVACLPTAAGSEGTERVAYWSDLGESYFARLGASVQTLPILDRTSANDPELARRLRQTNFVYLSGGRPNYLLSTLKDSLAWEAIQSVLQQGGIVAGCSAGAMVMGERIPAFPAWQRAFNLLPETVIVPHFDEIPASFGKTMKMFVSRNKILVGIEGYTALTWQGQQARVLGRGGVTIWDQSGRERYTAGQQVRWPLNGGTPPHENR